MQKHRFLGLTDRIYLRRFSLAFLLTASLIGVSLLGQGTRGTVSGTITDQTGGVLPGAEVTLSDVDTDRTVRTMVTNDEGLYRFAEIDPGNYQVSVEMTGFTAARSEPFVVQPNRNVQINISLSVAGTTDEVTVSAATELVDRESPTLGTTVEHERVEGLPLNGRDALQLARLQPGVANLDTSNFGSGLGFQVNGQRGTENNITLDGSNNNEVAVGGSMGVLPPPDAIEEFRLLTSNYEAEFGRNTGSIINVVTRSGGSQLHGNVRFFWRPTVLSAARYFDKAQASPDQADDDLRRTFERKEFGGNLGGPIYIPGVYDGRDRSFFFFDYEGRRQLIGATEVVSGLPTLAERSGDFSGLEREIVDPATGQPFPGNQIPQNRFSPIANYYLQFMPVPDEMAQAVVAANETTNFDQFVMRLDHAISPSHILGYTLNYYDRAIFDPFAFGGADVPGFGSEDLRTTQNHAVRYTYTISPTLINSFMVAYARNNQPALAPENNTSLSEIGFEDTFVANRDFEGPPAIVFFDREIQLGNSIQGPQARVPENFQLQDSLTWVKGDHRFKFGFDGTFYKQDQAFLFINQGILTYSGFFGANTTGDDFADFLIGNSPIASQFGANGLRDFRQYAAALFAQDSWRLSSAVTLSYGVRWEYTSPITDLFDRAAYYRPGSTSELLTSGQLTDPETGATIRVPEGSTAPDGLVYPGDPDNVLGGTVPRGGVEKDWNNFAPRLGLAYSPNPQDGFLATLMGDRQTVIRAGAGVYYGAIVGDTALQQLSAPGYNGTNAFFFPGSGTLADPFAPDPYPDFGGNQGQIPNPFQISEILVGAPLSQMSQPIDPNLRTPYSYHFNFTIERGFGQNHVVSASYVGNRNRKMYAREQVNPAIGTFIPVPEGRTIPTPTPTNTNSRRLNPDIMLGLPQLSSAANSSYDSLQLQLQRRLSDGLVYQLAYTWSKSITDLAGSTNRNTQRGLLDLVDRSAGRGLSLDDVPHRFVASWLYDLPFASNAGGVTGVLLDGWSLGGIATFESGRPFNVGNPFDTTGEGTAIISLADRGDEPFQQVNPRENNSQAFNQGAFEAFGDPAEGFDLAEDYRRGTLGPTQQRLHNGVNNFDLIVAKKTPLGPEDVMLELRAEFFNAFNHTQFSEANTNIVVDAFGRFTDARESRVIQLAARIFF